MRENLIIIMKQQIIEAFSNSMVNNQQVVKAVEETIKALSQTESIRSSI